MSLNVPDALVSPNEKSWRVPPCSGALEKTPLGVHPSDRNGRKHGVYETVREPVCPIISRSRSWPGSYMVAEDNVGMTKSAVFIGEREGRSSGCSSLTIMRQNEIPIIGQV